ncbi:class I SAM-dependent RNA methyltransferase [Rhodosalinus sp. 5P4]|uniref:THUMP domain-containing class I SAM-dependent RNA methyltransferase n=1 Tax=Rhodosalinus sp. 5P4 TaxID=3239196 RepID=UPI003523A549
MADDLRPDGPFEIFLAAPPGLEPVLADEAREKGFDVTATVAGGVLARGGWQEVWRANLELRGAGRVLVRLVGFPAVHLAQLDKRARRVPWGEVFRTDTPVRVEASCRRSRIYHEKAAAQRVAQALGGAGVPVSDEAELRVLVRIENNLVEISLDSSGSPLHRRGHKQAVGKAPLRETLAALFLRAAGFDGAEPVVDPMCGSGTFVIEAAEIAAGLAPGRDRTFAFERLAGFDPTRWDAMRATRAARDGPLRFHGFDRDAGAVRMSLENAARAGVDGRCAFARQAISDLVPPEGAPGLVIANPPYGGRIGDMGALRALYGRFGEVMRARFAGWRVALVTSEDTLARASGLPLGAGPQVPHGGLRVRLWQTAGPLG